MKKNKSSVIRAALGPELAQSVGLGHLAGGLGRDIRRRLGIALKEGAVFESRSTPLDIFRQSLATAIGNINRDGRADLFVRFLKEGPYEGEGDIPQGLQGKRLTSEQTASVISFISGHMINCFQGAVMEMLAVSPCLELLHNLNRNGRLSRRARLYVGDTVKVRQSQKRAFAKGADLHFLSEHPSSQTRRAVEICGIVEVKSYFPRPDILGSQLKKHVQRAQRGLRVHGREYDSSQISLGKSEKVLSVSVLPDDWKLPRELKYMKKNGRKFFRLKSYGPRMRDDKIERMSGDEWRITLRWSREAIAATAYDMTFWFMEKVGEVLYVDGVPKEWAEMTPADAGRNAAKMMLHYAIRPYVLKEQDHIQLTHKEKLEKQRAIALYNCYGFGYAIGMNYRDDKGRRDMLWPEDLDEIAANGETKNGGRIWE